MRSRSDSSVAHGEAATARSSSRARDHYDPRAHLSRLFAIAENVPTRPREITLDHARRVERVYRALGTAIVLAGLRGFALTRALGDRRVWLGARAEAMYLGRRLDPRDTDRPAIVIDLALERARRRA